MAPVFDNLYTHVRGTLRRTITTNTIPEER